MWCDKEFDGKGAGAGRDEEQRGGGDTSMA